MLVASIVNADAAVGNNTDPGCDDVAGAPLCAISAAINAALPNDNRTDDLTVNGQGARARGCANFGSSWEGSMFGGVRCTVSGQVFPTQPFSFVGPVGVAQRGCRFHYPDLFGGVLQRGTIKGRTITLKKPKVPLALVNLFNIDIGDVKAKGRGRIRRGDRAIVRISARLTGEVNGIHASCSVKWTTNFVRLGPPPEPPPPPPEPPPPPPQGCLPSSLAGVCTIIDFNALLDGTPTSDSAFSLVAVDGLYSPLGVNFRSRDDAGPTFSHPLHPNSSRSIVINDFSRTQGGTFNIVAEFSSPLDFVSADVLSAVGRSVTMTAKDAFGAVLGSTTSASGGTSTDPLKGNVALSGIGTISTVEFEAVPDPAVAGVGIDNLIFSAADSPSAAGHDRQSARLPPQSMAGYDENFRAVFDTIKKLITPPEEPLEYGMGFGNE